MFEFKTFVYLDVHKTGSTFICTALRKCVGEAPIRKVKHAGMRGDYDRSKFYFISVRNPLDQYKSLYSYGCDGSGKLFERLRDRGFGGLYDRSWQGFESWLALVLDAEDPSMVHPKYGACGDGRVCRLIGLHSFRVLSLALPDSYETLARCKDENDIREEYKSGNIARFVIRTETLRDDLAKLFETALRDRISDLPRALEFVGRRDPINASERVVEEHALNAALERRVREREWFLCEEFGY